jgi:hypothetical protein
MADDRPKAACFIAMPFGRKGPTGSQGPVIDFDEVYTHIERAVTAAGLECIRADFELGGGFIHKPMYERLLIAEYVVADLTFANPNVTYEVGVRHGASSRPTILIGAGGFLGELPFDFRPLRVMSYSVGEDGRIDAGAGVELEDGLRRRLRKAIDGESIVDNPIMHVTGWQAGRLEHDKTDVFLGRVAYAGEIGEEIRSALMRESTDAAIAELAAIETTLIEGGEVVAELHSALLGVYLGYRERKAYQRMVDMYPKMPPELRATPVVQEQLALATNRLAEASDGAAREAAEAGERDRAEECRARGRELRREAIAVLEDIDPSLVTAETWGIRGRIYKGWYEAEKSAGNHPKAVAMLSKAIETYEAGVRADMRDYYPGVNAVTLRLVRGKPEDLAALEQLAPVVRMAVDNAPDADSTEEQYWQAATKLELASAANDWEAANRHLETAMGFDVYGWMRDTTVANLEIHRQAFGDDPIAVEAIESLIEGLRE